MHVGTIGAETREKSAGATSSDASTSQAQAPAFKPASAHELSEGVQMRKVPVPQERFTPLKKYWMQLYTPITEQMQIDMRMNLKARRVELKTTGKTDDPNALQKCADFVQAFMYGFAVQDAIALLRVDDLYLECFEVKDVKPSLKGEHLARGVGRLAGKNGRTKFTIENATRTRIVIADKHIRILGSFSNIQVARNALCSLILGSPPGKVLSKLRQVVSRMNESA